VTYLEPCTFERISTEESRCTGRSNLPNRRHEPRARERDERRRLASSLVSQRLMLMRPGRRPGAKCEKRTRKSSCVRDHSRPRTIPPPFPRLQETVDGREETSNPHHPSFRLRRDEQKGDYHQRVWEDPAPPRVAYHESAGTRRDRTGSAELDDRDGAPQGRHLRTSGRESSGSLTADSAGLTRPAQLDGHHA